MKKIVFIGNIASPIQVKFSSYLSCYFDTEFWFHEHINKQRPKWWKIDLPERCKILERVILKKWGLYLSLNIWHELSRFDPDILILGGFKLPTNYLAYRWAKKRRKVIIVFSETFRKNGKLRYTGSQFRIIEWAYSNIAALFSSSKDAADQFIKVFPKLSGKIRTMQYPSDIDEYFNHPIRAKKDSYIFLFPNRLTEDYNPLMAIEIFKTICLKYPGSVLKMNACGELHEKCVKLIDELELNGVVTFLDSIDSWNNMHLVYRDSDILLFPAKFSNGNFTIIESMASGMGIVISSRILWNSSMIENGKNGFVCDLQSENFIESIERYINNPDLFGMHAAYNRRITKKFTMEATAEMFHTTISQLN